MPAFGLELLQLKADDDSMEEDELQEEEEQLNMHMHVRRAAAEAAAAAADAPASLHQLLRRSPVRAPSMTAPSHYNVLVFQEDLPASCRYQSRALLLCESLHRST